MGSQKLRARIAGGKIQRNVFELGSQLLRVSSRIRFGVGKHNVQARLSFHGKDVVSKVVFLNDGGAFTLEFRLLSKVQR